MSDPLIRPVAFPELTRVVAPVATTDVDDAGESIREAHRISRSIVARANEQAREIQAAAHEQGLEQGTRQAVEREGEALRNAVAAFTEATRRLAATGEQLHAALTAELPSMAVTIAERILRHELSVRPETLVHVLRDALGAVLPATRVEIRLHPDDIATVERHRALLAEITGGAELRVEASPDVGVGGCSIETESLRLDAGPLAQLERALALLRSEDA